MRVLDELADAFHAGRGHRLPRPLVSSVKLKDQFHYMVTDSSWAAVEDRLGCTLPPLEFNQGHWLLPDGLETIWDLAEHVVQGSSNCARPAEPTSKAWREAQIFAGVREVLAAAGNLDKDEIIRSARLRADLGLE